MNKEYDKEIYNKLQKLYAEMGWFRPFPTFEELFEDESQAPKSISIRIKIPHSNKHKSKKAKRSKQKKKGKKNSKGKHKNTD